MNPPEIDKAVENIVEFLENFQRIEGNAGSSLSFDRMLESFINAMKAVETINDYGASKVEIPNDKWMRVEGVVRSAAIIQSFKIIAEGFVTAMGQKGGLHAAIALGLIDKVLGQLEERKGKKK